ncbi:hypothetical protein GUJ93_ZPchr0013g36506 [Zizania palustris]|uniref:K+ potassium transporter integral membrane domain-containing protein n=1 Tax=Zizania palustris TaxID=103762 RepID=A0A8J6C2P6_ZIZPA|nr:hypothetical protein GUJ93_ZPchr0013g36506 [Zizania palustris]
MASLSESEGTNRGSMWELDQNLDQPMDEEASRLKNMYREKVVHLLFIPYYAENSIAAKIKRWLEAHVYKRNCLLILVLIGTCTTIRDGILTPVISVLSASGGIKVQNPNMSTDVVLVPVIILIGLFSMQHYGTDKVGWLFAPLVLLWFILFESVGANVYKSPSRT